MQGGANELYRAVPVKIVQRGRQARHQQQGQHRQAHQHDAEGRVDYYTQLENLPDLDYRLLVISVEPEPDPSPAADARRSLGGYFPNPELQIVSGTATPTLGPGVTATPGAPSTLPVTGATEQGLLILAAGLVVLLLGLAGIFKNRIRSPKP